jgi:hypothetical protein
MRMSRGVESRRARFRGCFALEIDSGKHRMLRHPDFLLLCVLSPWRLCDKTKRGSALIRPENVPSQGVAAKLGMTPGPQIVRHAGFDHLVYSIGRDEGPVQK